MSNENGDESTTNGEKRQNSTCESGTSGSVEFPKLKWQAGALCVEITRAEELVSEIAADRKKYSEALDEIRHSFRSLIDCAKYNGWHAIAFNTAVVNIDEQLKAVGK